MRLNYVQFFQLVIDLFCNFCYNSSNFNKKFCKKAVCRAPHSTLTRSHRQIICSKRSQA